MSLCRVLRLSQTTASRLLPSAAMTTRSSCLVTRAVSMATTNTSSCSLSQHTLRLPSSVGVSRCYATVPATAADIEARVLAVCRAFDMIKKDVAADTHFQHDLGLDSLDMVELVMKMEDEFGFEIPDADAEKFVTPAEIAKYICAKEEI